MSATLLAEQTTAQRFTYADYKALDVDDNFWYELINGELVKKSSPSTRHQRISMKLSSLMHVFVTEKNLGVVMCAPTDVFVDDENVPQPDIFFIEKGREHIITDDSVFGAPNLIVEIISPSSIRRDRKDKMNLYKRFGVAEYWIIDPNNKAVEIYHLTDGIYDLTAFAVESGSLESSAIPGFSLDIVNIF